MNCNPTCITVNNNNTTPPPSLLATNKAGSRDKTYSIWTTLGENKASSLLEASNYSFLFGLSILSTGLLLHTAFTLSVTWHQTCRLQQIGRGGHSGRWKWPDKPVDYKIEITRHIGIRPDNGDDFFYNIESMSDIRNQLTDSSNTNFTQLERFLLDLAVQLRKLTWTNCIARSYRGQAFRTTSYTLLVGAIGVYFSTFYCLVLTWRSRGLAILSTSINMTLLSVLFNCASLIEHADCVHQLAGNHHQQEQIDQRRSKISTVTNDDGGKSVCHNLVAVCSWSPALIELGICLPLVIIQLINHWLIRPHLVLEKKNSEVDDINRSSNGLGHLSQRRRTTR